MGPQKIPGPGTKRYPLDPLVKASDWSNTAHQITDFFLEKYQYNLYEITNHMPMHHQGCFTRFT